MKISLTVLSLSLVFLIINSVLIFILSHTILVMHYNENIYWISSDAPIYLYVAESLHLYEDSNLYTNLLISLIYNIIGRMDAYLILILLTVTISLYQFLNLFPNTKSKFLAFFGTLLIPYFIFGSYSINKEIFTICSSLLLTSYYLKGNYKFLIAALILAFFARSYMTLSIIFTLLIAPRDGKTNWILFIFSLLIFSILPLLFPNALSFGLNENLITDSRFATLFSKMTREGFYWLAYIPKYLLLVISKTWSLISLDFNIYIRKQDLMEFWLSIYSFFLVITVILTFAKKKRIVIYKKLIDISIIIPAPLLLTDIFHWRYISFVIIFLMTFSVLNNTKYNRSNP